MSLPYLLDKGVQALPGPVFAYLAENARKAGSIGGRRIARRTSKPGLFTVILVKILWSSLTCKARQDLLGFSLYYGLLDEGLGLAVAKPMAK